MFANRMEAGRLLAEKLLKYKKEKPVVIGLVRGGIPVAYEIAKLLESPLDVALVKKLGAPFQEELAIGAIVDGKTPQVFLNDEIISHIDIPKEYINRITKEKLEEIRLREKIYRRGEDRVSVRDRVVVVVDDGIATGASMKVVLKALRLEKPKKIVVAAPVAPPDTISLLERDADEIIVLLTPGDFYAVGAFYKDFSQTSDEEVISLLGKVKLKSS